MKNLSKILSIVVFVFFVSCDVNETISEDNLNSQLRSAVEDDLACETAFAFDNQTCFLEDGFNRWGWTLGSFSAPFESSFTIYAGAGRCNIESGTDVGVLNVSYVNGTVSVEFVAHEGYGFFATHLYIGNEKYPRLRNGKPTVAPGQYPYKHDNLDGVANDYFEVSGIEGDIYIIAHAEVCEVDEPCVADPGGLKITDSKLCLDKDAVVSATPDGTAVVPEGYQIFYFLTQGEELVIINQKYVPNFMLSNGDNGLDSEPELGVYTIHTFVYNPETLDISFIVFGVTTLSEVFSLLIDGGGEICASLDVTGASATVVKCEEPDPCKVSAGSLKAEASKVCLVTNTLLSATQTNAPVVPDGFAVIYVLTQGEGLVIVNAGAEPSFTVNTPGLYTIHTLVYNPDELDLSIVELGVTTGVDVLGLLIQGGGKICGALDVTGAPIDVVECK